MQDLIDLFVSVFNIATDIKLLNIPLLVWFIIPVLITLFVNFIKGSKGE